MNRTLAVRFLVLSGLLLGGCPGPSTNNNDASMDLGMDSIMESSTDGPTDSADSSSLNNWTVRNVTVSPRVLPSALTMVTITAQNTGSLSWDPAYVQLDYQGSANDGWNSPTLRLQNSVAPLAMGTFSAMLTAPNQVGRFQLAFRPSSNGTAFGQVANVNLEVTCSDGVFCNGIERFVSGQCQPGTNPCDDGVACTTDSCTENTGLCSHMLGTNCASCQSSCTADCTGKVCGDDGCGGSCGDCPSSTACSPVAGQCVQANQPGTCASPLPLLQVGTPLIGTHTISGDTSNGIDQAIPTCNSTSRSAEIVYVFTTTERVGLDARSSGYDTVLHLRREDSVTTTNDCLDNGPTATVACSDDASPPGDYGSRLATAIDPGTYYLIVDGFDATQFGAFSLSVRFVANGCIPACGGQFCGVDDGCGGNCGVCDSGFACVEGRCQQSPCVPNCTGRTCGDNGCGGECGSCLNGQLCVPSTGSCQTFAMCNHDQPVCTPGCGAGQFCGTDCQCYQTTAALPDLVVQPIRLRNEIIFDEVMIEPSSCSVVERCVGGTGLRRLMRFSVEAINQGLATLQVPQPSERPDLFVFSQCHGHYHFQGFAEYALLDMQGNVIVTGRKQAYCMEDTSQVLAGPNIGCDKLYSCDNQGIQAGWSDLYGNTLDCQWLDITEVPPGDYRLQVSLNPGRTFMESSFDNNVTTVDVTVLAR